MLRRLTIPALDAALAGAAFLLGAGLIRPLVPYPEDGRLGAKLEHFAHEKDDYDAIVLGASRAHRGLDPRIVEAELAAAGRPLRVFNLAAPASWALEQDHLLHELLALEPARLSWVFYGGRPVGMTNREQHPSRDDPNRYHERNVRWHTLRGMRSVWRTLRVAPLSTAEKLGLLVLHLDLLARNLSNLGRGPAIVRGLRLGGIDAAERRLQLSLHERRGYFGLEEQRGQPHSEELDELLDDPEEFARSVAGIARASALPVDLDTIDLELYREQIRACEERGIRIVYFTAPGYEGDPERPRLAEAGVLPALLHFDDPVRFPELFRLEERFDPGHLNDAGTRRFSTLFARAVLDLMSSERAE